MNFSIPPISGKDILAEQPNISKKELKECIKLSKKSKMLGYATTGMNSATSAMMLSTGQTGLMIAGGVFALMSLLGLRLNSGMSKFHNALKEAYKIKYSA